VSQKFEGAYDRTTAERCHRQNETFGDKCEWSTSEHVSNKIYSNQLLDQDQQEDILGQHFLVGYWQGDAVEPPITHVSQSLSNGGVYKFSTAGIAPARNTARDGV